MKDKLKAIVCAFVGHTNIEEYCMGYHHCARCGALLGDSLAGAYQNKAIVGMEHDCAVCETNYLKLTWRDKFLVKTPLVGRSVEERAAAKMETEKIREWIKSRNRSKAA